MTLEDSCGEGRGRRVATSYCNLSYSTPSLSTSSFVALADRKQQPLAVGWRGNVTAVSLSAEPLMIVVI